MPLVDLTGSTYERLTVLSRASNAPGQRGSTWLCRCTCGAEVRVKSNDLRTGNTKSCGCLRREIGHMKNRTHGGKGTPEYRAWAHAKERCFDSNDKQYADYGGRGITMAPEWINDFPAFLAHMGPRPEGTTLDREDNDGHYAPGNCRWATRTVQANNRRPRRYWKKP